MSTIIEAAYVVYVKSWKHYCGIKGEYGEQIRPLQSQLLDDVRQMFLG